MIALLIPIVLYNRFFYTNGSLIFIKEMYFSLLLLLRPAKCSTLYLESERMRGVLVGIVEQLLDSLLVLLLLLGGLLPLHACLVRLPLLANG